VVPADCSLVALKPAHSSRLLPATALGHRSAIYFTLFPDDQARPPYITGRLAAFARNVYGNYLITATLAQQRLPGLFAWPGKGRYERARRLKRAMEEQPQTEGKKL
jgi:hypothetical protein